MERITWYNKRKLILEIIFLVTLQPGMSSFTYAQPDRAVAMTTPKGIFIYLGHQVPKQFYYEVEGKTNRGEYAKLAVIKAPQSQQEMETRLEQHRAYFENLDPLTKKETERMWKYLKTSSVMDSLYIPNLPIMHLASGTAYLDNKTEVGKDYQYRVRRYKSDGTLIAQNETNSVKLPASPNLLKPQFKEKKESQRQIVLHWFVPQQRQLASYNVFRRVYGQGEFQKAQVIKGFNTNHDSIFFMVIDTTMQNPAHYEYLVQPLDAYGNPGPVSDPVGAGTLGDKYIPVVRNVKARNTGNAHEINLSWRFDARKYLRSLEIHRSAFFDNGFVKIAELAPSDTSYTDHLPQGAENYYYYVVVNGPSGKGYPSAVVSVLYHDEAIPEPPLELDAESITNGVRVHWTYQEPYVKGFLIYRSSFPDKDFKVISDLLLFDSKLMSYADTSRALLGNQAYYYAIQAVSDSDISSKLSGAINVRPGVRTKISSPANLNVRWENEAVMIAWDGLQDIETDLSGYLVFRKEEGQADFHAINEQADGSLKNYYYDSHAEAGKTYQYCVQAQDFFGAKSSLSNMVTFQVPLSKPASPSRILLSSTKEGIHIAWSQVVSNELENLKLYRQESGQTPKLISRLDKDQLDYLDKTVERGKLYSYYITAVNTKNIEGNAGELATIRY